MWNFLLKSTEDFILEQKNLTKVNFFILYPTLRLYDWVFPSTHWNGHSETLYRGITEFPLKEKWKRYRLKSFRISKVIVMLQRWRKQTQVVNGFRKDTLYYKYLLTDLLYDNKIRWPIRTKNRDIVWSGSLFTDKRRMTKREENFSAKMT